MFQTEAEFSVLFRSCPPGRARMCTCRGHEGLGLERQGSWGAGRPGDPFTVSSETSALDPRVRDTRGESRVRTTLIPLLLSCKLMMPTPEEAWFCQLHLASLHRLLDLQPALDGCSTPAPSQRLPLPQPNVSDLRHGSQTHRHDASHTGFPKCRDLLSHSHRRVFCRLLNATGR